MKSDVRPRGKLELSLEQRDGSGGDGRLLLVLVAKDALSGHQASSSKFGSKVLLMPRPPLTG
jgi:hypothetical protein